MNIRRRLQFVLLMIACGALTGCISQISEEENVRFSPLEVRAVQTRTFHGHEMAPTLKTVLDVLLDEGYLVKFGDEELGVLHGSKTLSGWTSGFYRVPSHVKSTLQATVHVTEFGDSSKVRIAFHQVIDQSFGNGTVSHQILDPQHYQDFFAKLDRGLFIQKQGL